MSQETRPSPNSNEKDLDTTPFHEGNAAYWEDHLEEDNPYLRPEDRSKLKQDWPQEAQDWDDGWCNAFHLDDYQDRQESSI